MRDKTFAYIILLPLEEIILYKQMKLNTMCDAVNRPVRTLEDTTGDKHSTVHVFHGEQRLPQRTLYREEICAEAYSISVQSIKVMSHNDAKVNDTHQQCAP